MQYDNLGDRIDPGYCVNLDHRYCEGSSGTLAADFERWAADLERLARPISERRAA
jgi:hypothetical protein